MQTTFIKPETLDTLAEQILIACSQVADAEGTSTMPRLDHSKALEAIRLSLNEMFGGGHNWAVLGEWPRPEQMSGVQAHLEWRESPLNGYVGYLREVL